MLFPASYKQEDTAVNHSCGDYRQITLIISEKTIALDLSVGLLASIFLWAG